MLHLGEVDAIDFAEGAVDQGAEELGELQRADETGQAGDISRKCDLK